MKKRVILILTLALAIFSLLVISVSAEAAIYDDAPERVNIEVREDDIVVFDDGYSCLSAYVFKDQTTLPKGKGYNPTLDDACDFSYINGKTGKEYTFNNIVSFDIPQGVTSIGNFACTALSKMKKISIPNTVTSIGASAFQESSSLEFCIFEHSEASTLENIPSAAFAYCSSLKAISIPDCVRTISGPDTFKDCKKLTAMYLSKNLISIESSNPDKSTFGCNNIYFVNEPFTEDIPEKPDVYYFPKSLEIVGEACTFRWWSSLNKVLVFGESLTTVPNCYAFENSSQKTIVFLGDMTEVNLSDCGATSVYFANKNDIDAESAGLNIERLKGDGTVAKRWSGAAYYCNAIGNTNHLVEKIIEVPAQCEIDAGVATVCFCGYEISKDSVTGTALTHDYDYENNDKAILVGIVYSDYTENGVKTVTCANCGKNSDFETPALFVNLGFSAAQYGNMISVNYKVNSQAVKEYENATDEKLNYGVFAVRADRIETNDDIIDDEGKALDGVIAADITDSGFTLFNLKITGFTDAQKDISLAMGAYVGTTKDEKTTYSYLQIAAPTNGKYYCASYNDVLALTPSDDEESAQ